MSGQNPPRGHHFAPAFYLKKWSGSDGALEQFSRPGSAEVKARRLPATATGFQEDLYRLPGLPAALAQQIELGFMQTVDSQAAAILEELEGGATVNWSTEKRSAWTRFIQSLQLRTPADIGAIKSRTHSEWGETVPSIQAQYEAMRGPSDPLTLEEFISARDPHFVERAALKIATRLIDNPKLGEHINNMVWDVLDCSDSNLELLTSDRAVEQVRGLAHPMAFITLPIGPKKLFIAANQSETIDVLRQANARELVRNRNHFTVSLAREFVWASNRAQQKFITRNFSIQGVPTLGQRLALAPMERAA